MRFYFRHKKREKTEFHQYIAFISLGKTLVRIICDEKGGEQKINCRVHDIMTASHMVTLSIASLTSFFSGEQNQIGSHIRYFASKCFAWRSECKLEKYDLQSHSEFGNRTDCVALCYDL